MNYSLTRIINHMIARNQSSSLLGLQIAISALLLALLTTPAHSLQSNMAGPRRLLSEAASSLAAQTVNYCKIYSDAAVCLYCVRNYYLSNNVCVAIPSASQIARCNIYTNATSCYQCDSGYYPINNTCAVSNATNCLIAASATTCLACNTGSILVNNVCQVLTNCVQSNANGCTGCATGFYVSNGLCIPLAANFTAVLNCAAYTSSGVCSQCNLGYILEAGGSACYSTAGLSSEMDPNCIDLQVNNGRYCSLCRQGYYLVNGQCQATASTLTDSCFLYDPANNANCKICMTGYSMTSPGAACAVNNQAVAGQTDPLSVGAYPVLINALLIIFVTFRIL